MWSSLFEVFVQVLDLAHKKCKPFENLNSINTATMSSNTFTLTGKSSKLSCNIFPDLVLDESSEYSCALLELTAFHSLPNVSENINNKFYFYQTETKKGYDGIEDNFRDYLHELQIPTGGYEADKILDYKKREMVLKGFRFEYEINKNTIKTKKSCSTSIYIGD